MRVAVLGASGFIGGRIVERLHLLGSLEVRPVVRAASRLAGAARFALDARVADGRDHGALARALAGCDAAIHAIAGDRRTILGTAETAYRAAEEAGVRRLIYLSSASVHGQAPAPGTNESSALVRRQPIAYNRARIDAEMLLRRLRRSGSVELVILRPGIVFGPRSHWTGGLADDLLAGGAVLVDGGTGICNALYVDNLVHAIELSLTALGADGEAFLLGEEETVTWRDLYRPVVEALGLSLEQLPTEAVAPPTGWGVRTRQGLRSLPRPLRIALRGAAAALRASHGPAASPWHRPSPPRQTTPLETLLLHRCRTKLPWTKARDRLGYHPIVSFEEGCRRSVAWLEFAGYPVEGRH